MDGCCAIGWAVVEVEDEDDEEAEDAEDEVETTCELG